MNSEGDRFRDYRRSVAALGLFLLLFGASVGGYRAVTRYQVPGPFSHENAGFCDFHNGLYFPTAALIRGISPYGEVYCITYPVDRQVPFFSPGFFALHAPLAMLPLHVAEAVYFLLIIAVTVAIGYLVASIVGRHRRWDIILLIAGLLMVSRGGQSTLYVGYFTMEIVLATLLAVHWGNRKPWLAALALVFVSAKPTYILPLGFLMLARGNFKALMIGAVLSVAAAAMPLAWLASHASENGLLDGISQIAEDIRATQDVHMLVADEMPVNTWTRIDFPAIVAKWMAADPGQGKLLMFMMMILPLPMWVLFRRYRRGIDDGAAGLTGLLIFSAFLASLYHQSYDAMVLIAPLIGIWIGTPDAWQQDHARSVGRWSRLGLATLIILPLYSFFSTRTLLGRLDPGPVVVQTLASVSGICIAILMVWACWLAWRQKPGAREHDVSASGELADDQSAEASESEASLLVLSP